MVGDRFHDVQGARACGLDCVGVTFGYGGKDELVQAGAAEVVSDYRGCTVSFPCILMV